MSSVMAHRTGRAGGATPAGGFVLPRWLRPHVRMAVRLFSGDVEAPRSATPLLIGGFLAASVLAGTIQGGHMPAVTQYVAARTGFAISEVAISGNDSTSEIDVVGALALDGWTALLGFSPEEARERIVKLPWVESATVRKIYPATIEVNLTERKAFALWQDKDGIQVIERDGKVIAPYEGGRFAALPLVVGEGAASRAELFIAGMARFPGIASRVKGYVRVGDRRWDLKLDNGVTVKLPEKGELAAIQRLEALQVTDGILDRDVVAIDMRLDDRIAVQLAEGAAKARAESVKKIMDAETKRGRKI